jgi:hypothetical protein
MKFRDDIKVRDTLFINGNRRGGDDRGDPPKGAPPIRLESNVHLALMTPAGEVVERRDSHNIFLDYGRDWLSHLVSLDAAAAHFRDDRVCYMCFGIGGTAQRIGSDLIRGTIPGPYSYPGFPDDWVGGTGAGDPAQTDTDPTITALEWPVEVTNAGTADYYDEIFQPATFPGTVGIVRFTAVLGLTQVSFGAHPSVPLSEIGLITEKIDDVVLFPLGHATPPVVAGPLPVEKCMVAYNTFDTISKTTDFVLQVDWELRFA